MRGRRRVSGWAVQVTTNIYTSHERVVAGLWLGRASNYKHLYISGEDGGRSLVGSCE